MNFTPVSSSDIAAVATDRNDLVIKFKSGGIYKYVNAAKEFNNLINANSCGKYFHHNIKNYYIVIKLS